MGISALLLLFFIYYFVNFEILLSLFLFYFLWKKLPPVMSLFTGTGVPLVGVSLLAELCNSTTLHWS
jgi:hypothetical protein